VRVAVAALVLGTQSGGAPARAVDGVAAGLRARIAVAAEVRALSTQARLSAVIIAVAPVAFAILASATDAGIAGVLFGTRVGGVLLTVGLALDGAGALWMARICRRPPAARRGAGQVSEDLPEVVDLFAVAVGAGLTVRLAVEAVAARGAGPLAAELRRALAHCARGRLLADALADLPARAGEAVRPLVAALGDADRYGSPLGPALDSLAADARDSRRRRAEERARRVPVLLLFPLVLCILPAFGLLTVAPMLAGALDALAA
jgi:tight adherence protein C